MGLDIRLPIGAMFALLGLLLSLYGLVSDKAIYKRSLGLNINLVWGGVLLMFGILMLALGRRGTADAQLLETDAEVRKVNQEITQRTSEDKLETRRGDGV